MQEKKVAEEVGGQVVPASGATLHSKGDVTSPTEKIECKYTLSSYYHLKFADLIKLKIQAAKDSAKVPVFILEFQGQNKGAYVMTFVSEFPEDLQNLQSRAKSMTIVAGDLLYSAIKIKSGPILGIKFYDYDNKMWRHITITTYQRWLDGRTTN